ncbi:uncharacterized protein LOC103460166 isoform X2 [Poecilia reticulata]|uniref:uncharacterized protein LOC103460166 isoform X2 n=1 Tax=Poecilia reticulata TaxID=8081 RepID=UPI0007E9623B|nr:PREDICTED: uncharacterized protein LOC103460166 isoform X2 [Poecilia reticulata]
MAAPKNAFSMSQFICFFSLVFSSCSSIRLRDCLATRHPPGDLFGGAGGRRGPGGPPTQPGGQEQQSWWSPGSISLPPVGSRPVHGVVLGPLEGLQPQEEAAGEPARSKLARIHHFLSFLANGGRWSSTWTALENVRRIYEWPEHLLRGGKAVTTIKLYFVNIMEFMGYFKETPPPTFRVSKRTLVAVHRVLSSTVSSLGRRVAIHQIQVKSAKLRHLVPKRHLRACRARCREEILCVLDNLEKDSTWEHMRKFYPLLSLYISCVYGHRTGVLQNDRSGGQARSSRDKE